MKRLCFLAVLCFCTAALFAQRVGSTMSVNVNSAALKSSTGFFASTAGTVRYGDQVQVLALKGKWVQVKAVRGNVTGWIASSSLTTKVISTQGNAGNTSAREVAMAGKGFSPEVESEYKKGGGTINYGAVDAMEKANVSERDLLAFIEEGHLAKGEE